MLGIRFVVIFEDSAHACADSVAESVDSLRRQRTAFLNLCLPKAHDFEVCQRILLRVQNSKLEAFFS